MDSSHAIHMYPVHIGSPAHAESHVPQDLNDHDAVVLPPGKFCDCECWSYFLGCFFSIVVLLVIGGVFLLFAPPLGLLIAAVAPGVVILLASKRYYKSQVTNGQMTVSFFETIMWMIPLLVWDLVWILAIAPQLKEGGLCGLCVLAYLLQAYFFAGFCEEVTKFIVISRITNSALTADWRAMMVYGISAGCGFATAENIAYVFASGLPTAIVRAFVSVPLHCCTGAIIGLEISKRRPLSTHCESLSKVIWPVLLYPWLMHGSFNFLLMIGEGSRSSLGVLGFVGAFIVFAAGMSYCRVLSFRVREQESSCGRLKIDIHQRIESGQPPVIGLPSIRQWGHSSECVCSCCFVCQCCCKSQQDPRPLGYNRPGGNVTRSIPISSNGRTASYVHT